MDVNSYDLLLNENKKLKEMIRSLKSQQEKNWSDYVDNKVDNWFEKNKDEVDIGRISVFEFMGNKCEIDVLPDVMEKAIYKKCIKIMLSMVSEIDF
tara:strand:+ start:1621 stop:1908 length:288 start_codon:yes stop_codon:yes gene_type:complete